MIQSLRRNLPDYGVLVLIIAIFALGGSAREDMASVPPLRFIGCVALALALVTTPRPIWHANRSLLTIAFAWAVLGLIHLLPLPPGLWHALPGRELAVQIDAAAGLGDVWRPLSLVPWRTVNALFSLTIPLAIMLFALRSDSNQASRIVYVLLALVLVSAMVGLLQIIGGTGNPFYTYRVTNEGSAVGLFANRNHNAIFLALGFPLIAAALALAPAVAENVKLREWAGAGAAILLIPFILTTQSRAGILVGALSLALGLWTYRSPLSEAQRRRPRKQLDPRLIFGGLAAAGMVALTVVLTATNAIERLGRLGQEDDELRLQIWPPIWDLIGDFMPLGSGMGTFVEVYKTIEPPELLSPSYVNHAHNDWLEIMLTGGIPAIAIVVAAIVLFAKGASYILQRSTKAQDVVLRRLGASICLVLAVASLYDYPLRTPSLAALLATGAAFALRRRPRSAGE